MLIYDLSSDGCSVRHASANRASRQQGLFRGQAKNPPGISNCRNRNLQNSIRARKPLKFEADNSGLMDPKFSFPLPYGKPLVAVSQERANRQPLPPSLTSIPSEPARLRDPFTSGDTGTSSESQLKFAQFSKEAIQRRKDNEAALKRAIMGREEAENEVRRFKEENQVLRNEIEEGRGRERRVAERVEGVMVGDILITTKEQC